MWGSIPGRQPLAWPQRHLWKRQVFSRIEHLVLKPRRDKTCWVSPRDWIKLLQFKVHKQKSHQKAAVALGYNFPPELTASLPGKAERIHQELCSQGNKQTPASASTPKMKGFQGRKEEKKMSETTEVNSGHPKMAAQIFQTISKI